MRRVAIILKCPPYNELADYLENRLKKQMPVLVLATKNSSITGGIELAIQELYLAHHLGLKEGIDISKPKYPKEAKGLYSWIPKNSTNNEFNILYDNLFNGSD